MDAEGIGAFRWISSESPFCDWNNSQNIGVSDNIRCVIEQLNVEKYRNKLKY